MCQIQKNVLSRKAPSDEEISAYWSDFGELITRTLDLQVFFLEIFSGEKRMLLSIWVVAMCIAIWIAWQVLRMVST